MLVDIVVLRNRSKLTKKEISRHVRRSEKVVEKRLKVLLEKGSAQRLRKQKMTAQEQVEFDKDAASYYRQGFTYNETAWVLASNYSAISNSLSRSAKKSEIIRRRNLRKA